jgi:hypothetical protein
MGCERREYEPDRIVWLAFAPFASHRVTGRFAAVAERQHTMQTPRSPRQTA